jgi:hypothetical protein
MRIGLPEALTAAPARRREKLWIVLLALLVVIAGAAGAQAQQRVRKNIDTLSHEELRNYIHAVQKVIEISKANPDSTDGMSYFEALHNDLDFGPCEHGRDTFFPWHRAHLYLFEDAPTRRARPM